MTAHSVATFLGAVLVLTTTDENMPDHLETIRAALEGGDDVENVEEVITSFKNEYSKFIKTRFWASSPSQAMLFANLTI